MDFKTYDFAGTTEYCDILFFKAGDFRHYGQMGFGDDRTYGAIRMERNYYQTMLTANICRSVGTPSAWFSSNSVAGWYIEGADDTGYIPVSCQWAGSSANNYVCTIQQDYRVIWDSGIYVVQDGHSWNVDYSYLIDPEIMMVRDSSSPLVVTVKTDGGDTVSDIQLPFVLSDSTKVYPVRGYNDASGKMAFGSFMYQAKMVWKFAQGTTFTTSNFISSICMGDLTSGLSYYKVPNPIDLVLS